MTVTEIERADDEVARRYAARIESHRDRLRRGHDPMGHLFAIERLARAARAEWWAARRAQLGRRPQ
jgi:hypothetical protein